MLDYDEFIENTLPSVIQFSKLFLNDIEWWVRCTDVSTEELLLKECMGWVVDVNHYEEDPARKAFYGSLLAELEGDRSEVSSKSEDTMKLA